MVLKPLDRTIPLLTSGPQVPCARGYLPPGAARRAWARERAGVSRRAALG